MAHEDVLVWFVQCWVCTQRASRQLSSVAPRSANVPACQHLFSHVMIQHSLRWRHQELWIVILTSGPSRLSVLSPNPVGGTWPHYGFGLSLSLPPKSTSLGVVSWPERPMLFKIRSSTTRSSSFISCQNRYARGSDRRLFKQGARPRILRVCLHATCSLLHIACWSSHPHLGFLGEGKREWVTCAKPDRLFCHKKKKKTLLLVAPHSCPPVLVELITTPGRPQESRLRIHHRIFVASCHHSASLVAVAG